MRISTASVHTIHGSRYLQQLSKHWGHKFPVTFTAVRADIQLPYGHCTLEAADDRLQVQLTFADDTDADRFEGIVAEHLKRFGFRETLQFMWRRT